MMARTVAAKQPSAHAHQAALVRTMAKAFPEVPFIGEFHRYLNVEHNASRHTLDAYRRDLRQFFEFLAHHSGAQAALSFPPKPSSHARDGRVESPHHQRRHHRVQNIVGRTASAQERSTSGYSKLLDNIDHHSVRAYLGQLHQRGLENATVPESSPLCEAISSFCGVRASARIRCSMRSPPRAFIARCRPFFRNTRWRTCWIISRLALCWSRETTPCLNCYTARACESAS